MITAKSKIHEYKVDKYYAAPNLYALYIKNENNDWTCIYCNIYEFECKNKMDEHINKDNNG